MNRLALIRHAHAGERDRWQGDDRLRPLSERGLAQARALAADPHLGPLAQVWSSPAVRCFETVAPLAERLGLAVATDERLFEEADAEMAYAWLASLTATRSLAACSHGDLIPGLLDRARQDGCAFPDVVRWQKGSAWLLEHDGRHFSHATYLPPGA